MNVGLWVLYTHILKFNAQTLVDEESFWAKKLEAPQKDCAPTFLLQIMFGQVFIKLLSLSKC